MIVLKLAPLSTTNLINIIQILVVALGFIFSWMALKATHESIRTANGSLAVAMKNTETAMKNLELAAKSLALGTSNAQVQLYNQMIMQGRDLQFRFAELFHGGSDAKEVQARREQFVGTLIGYYSSCFELKKVLELPSNVQKLLDPDLSEVMRAPQVREKWPGIKHFYSQEFVAYMDSLRRG
jgi:predicted O-linked N-acetylglucosamine transferase (SPINDLY family)